MNPSQVWQAALSELQVSMSRATFETWVRSTTAVSIGEGDRFTIAAPNTFAKEWLDTRFRKSIETTLSRILDRPTILDVVVGNGHVAEAVPAGRVRRQPAPADPPNPSLMAAPVGRDDGGRARAETAAPARRRSGRRSSETPPAAFRQNDLDDRWSFNSFIVGPSNRFAFAASQAVADAPATTYNPLFIHGGVGLGKTHLLQAIAHETRRSGLRTLYVTCEQFTNDLIDAIQRRQTDAFRDRYRSNDILLVDDIQFLAGKESTQEEFFHTFNDLHTTRRQVVISSDRPPRAIATLEQRLTSRFEWGLIVDIQPPDVETRTAILRARAAHQSLSVPDDVLALVAQRVQRNVRELEGALTTVIAFADLNGAPLNVETAARALSEVTAGRQRPLVPSAVVDAVSGFFKVDVKLLRGKQRDREIVVPRQIAMYLMREETTASLLEIGRELGGRDHSTVLHGWEKIRGDVEVDDQLRRDVLSIRERLLASAY
ncbi:MAG: chromosomal replication initiator protein DnaA [Chloroflexota bacterium]|nr:MAG: chromosomal replication initiator protein DnaA [Chloroflexota bacterium]